MEVVMPQEFSYLAMVFPKFKGLPGRKRDNWRPHLVAIILLDKTMRFIHLHQRLKKKTPAPVNLGDKEKNCWFKERTWPHSIRMIKES
jgi:hypothetical protein